MKRLYFIAILVLVSMVHSGNTVIEEKILAVVGDEPILLTEVEMAIIMDIGSLPDSDVEYNRLVRERLNAIIDEKLLYEAAIRESLVVDEDYLDQAFDERWQEMQRSFATEDLFKDALKNEGYNIPEFKRQMRVKLREALTKQRFIQKLVGDVDVNRDYVAKFYDEYRDSLPEKPAMVRLSVLVLRKDMTDLNTPLMEIAKDIVDGIKAVEDIETVGKSLEAEYPNLDISYGELGTFSKGDLYETLDSTAFSLKNGEVSSPVNSPAGVHILLRTGGIDDATIQHVTISGEIEQGVNPLRQMADEIYTRLVTHPDSFDTFVQLYSNSSEEADLGYFETEKMDPELRVKVQSAEAGEIMPPLYDKNEVDIFRITEKHKAGPVTPDTDYDTLVELARQHRISELVQGYLDRIRSDVFIDIRIDD